MIMNNCTIRYGDMKKQLAEDMVTFIAPIREKANAIQNDETYLTRSDENRVRKKQGQVPGQPLKLVRKAMGLNYF